MQVAVGSPKNQKVVNEIQTADPQKCLIIICAYNEERNLPCLLEVLKGKEILVIDDGSSDRTGRIAADYGARVLVHETRCGKSSSLAEGMSYAVSNGYETVVEIGADAIPKAGALRRITKCLEREDVGAVSCKQMPIGRRGIAYYIDELIWSILAHGKKLQMRSSGSSHLGAVMFGFKTRLVDSVEGFVNDDEQVGLSIRDKGYSIVFEEEAMVYFDASTCLGHIFERRKRMYFGHMKFSQSSAPSMQIGTSLLALAKSILENPRRIVWIIPTVCTDFYARLLAWRDTKSPQRSKNYSRWVTTYEKDNTLVIRNRLIQ